MNNSRKIRSSEQNKRYHGIIAVATFCGAQIRLLIIAADAHWAFSRAVHVLRLVSTADSRIERLQILLPVFIRPSCIACMYTYFSCRCYLPAIQWNKRSPQLVAALKQMAKNGNRGLWSKKYGTSMCLHTFESVWEMSMAVVQFFSTYIMVLAALFAGKSCFLGVAITHWCPWSADLCVGNTVRTQVLGTSIQYYNQVTTTGIVKNCT